MPPALCPDDISLEDEIDAFVFADTKGLLIATSETPIAQVGEFAHLKAIEIQDFGAFFDLGITKDLLVPGNEQKVRITREDVYHLVRVCLEEGTDRIFGTTKFGKYLENMDFDIKEGDKVDLFPVDDSDLGYRVIVNKKYLGLIYHSEIFKEIELGTPVEGYVKKIREDGFVDCALQIQGIKNLDNSKRVILNHLFKQNGKSHLHDKSSPDEIQRILNMSKKTFKNALGMLYKDKMVLIHKDGIELIHKKKS
jgi:predicted RNA-binding protein (virulence factor B family)